MSAARLTQIKNGNGVRGRFCDVKRLAVGRLRQCDWIVSGEGLTGQAGIQIAFNFAICCCHHRHPVAIGQGDKEAILIGTE